LRETFGHASNFDWSAISVIDDFDKKHSVDDVAKICQAVGFNTIPAWLRPYGVLSNGEKFRVDLARRLLEGGEFIVCDEFTSVVDRQVAKIGSHAVQKFVRRNKRQFVAASCHYDLEEWLQPDWVLEPATMVFRWRSVQRRPGLNCSIAHFVTLAVFVDFVVAFWLSESH
jgi:ABC-type ATPase with predicted acetyltransferase domain